MRLQCRKCGISLSKPSDVLDHLWECNPQHPERGGFAEGFAWFLSLYTKTVMDWEIQ
jgi:hypothetical protein